MLDLSQYWLLLFIALFLSQKVENIVCCLFSVYCLHVINIESDIDMDIKWLIYNFSDVVFCLFALTIIKAPRDKLTWLSCWFLYYLSNYQYLFLTECLTNNRCTIFNILNGFDVYNLDSIINTNTMFIYKENKKKAMLFYCFWLFLCFSNGD